MCVTSKDLNILENPHKKKQKSFKEFGATGLSLLGTTENTKCSLDLQKTTKFLRSNIEKFKIQ